MTCSRGICGLCKSLGEGASLQGQTHSSPPPTFLANFFFLMIFIFEFFSFTITLYTIALLDFPPSVPWQLFYIIPPTNFPHISSILATVGHKVPSTWNLYFRSHFCKYSPRYSRSLLVTFSSWVLLDVILASSAYAISLYSHCSFPLFSWKFHLFLPQINKKNKNKPKHVNVILCKSH